MMTQQLGFTVLSAPVALCDRRALSEAWYSALHVQKARTPATHRVRSDAALRNSNSGAAQESVSGKMTGVSSSVAVRVATAPALPGSPPNDRRLLRSKLARRIEQAFLAPKSPPKHATFALDGARGRVQILLRENAGQTQIVALCPPAAREIVAHALSQARYALALRGIAIRAEVRGFVR